MEDAMRFPQIRLGTSETVGIQQDFSKDEALKSSQSMQTFQSNDKGDASVASFPHAPHCENAERRDAAPALPGAVRGLGPRGPEGLRSAATRKSEGMTGVAQIQLANGDNHRLHDIFLQRDPSGHGRIDKKELFTLLREELNVLGASDARQGFRQEDDTGDVFSRLLQEGPEGSRDISWEEFRSLLMSKKLGGHCARTPAAIAPAKAAEDRVTGERRLGSDVPIVRVVPPAARSTQLLSFVQANYSTSAAPKWKSPAWKPPPEGCLARAKSMSPLRGLGPPVDNAAAGARPGQPQRPLRRQPPARKWALPEGDEGSSSRGKSTATLPSNPTVSAGARRPSPNRRPQPRPIPQGEVRRLISWTMTRFGSAEALADALGLIDSSAVLDAASLPQLLSELGFPQDSCHAAAAVVQLAGTWSITRASIAEVFRRCSSPPRADPAPTLRRGSLSRQASAARAPARGSTKRRPGRSPAPPVRLASTAEIEQRVALIKASVQTRLKESSSVGMLLPPVGWGPAWRDLGPISQNEVVPSALRKYFSSPEKSGWEKRQRWSKLSHKDDLTLPQTPSC